MEGLIFGILRYLLLNPDKTKPGGVRQSTDDL